MKNEDVPTVGVPSYNKLTDEDLIDLFNPPGEEEEEDGADAFFRSLRFPDQYIYIEDHSLKQDE